MSEEISLNYGKGQIGAYLTGGRFLGEIRPHPIPPVGFLKQEILRCLKRPVHSEPLALMARKARRVVIAVSDHTRVVPTGTLLEAVWSEIGRTGLSPEAVTVVIGVGNHRPVSLAEKRAILGPMSGKLAALHSGRFAALIR